VWAKIANSALQSVFLPPTCLPAGQFKRLPVAHIAGLIKDIVKE
jgi:hypothetical protein